MLTIKFSYVFLNYLIIHEMYTSWNLSGPAGPLGQNPTFYPEIPQNLMFEKCEFCEKWAFEIVNFVKNEALKIVNFVKNETLKIVNFVKNEILKMWIFG